MQDGMQLPAALAAVAARGCANIVPEAAANERLVETELAKP